MTAISINKPLRIGEVTIIAMDRDITLRDETEDYAWWYHSKEPVAVVACDSHGVRAFLVPEGEITWQELQRKFPDIVRTVTQCTACRVDADRSE